MRYTDSLDDLEQDEISALADCYDTSHEFAGLGEMRRKARQIIAENEHFDACEARSDRYHSQLDHGD